MTLAQSGIVVLRRLSPKDIYAFTSYRNDPEVARYQGWEPMDDDRSLGFLEAMAEAELLQRGRWCQLGVALVSSDGLIGDVGICVSEDGSEAELGITLSRGAQGLGLGFEAVTMVCDWLFDQTEIARIVAITHAKNAKALALLARSPFVHTHDTNDIIDGVETPERWFELRRG